MIKFYFDSVDFEHTFKMVIVDVDGNGEVRRIAKKVDLVWEEPIRGAALDYTLEFFPSRMQDIKQAIQDGLDDYDIMHGKKRSIDMVKGELDATKFHLEDMRLLAKVRGTFIAEKKGDLS